MSGSGQPPSLSPGRLEAGTAPSHSAVEERDRHFFGHAAVFDVVDRAGDVFRRGAFAGADTVPLLRDHRGNPIGSVSVREDERGLAVEGSAVGVRVGDGLSVGFRAKRVAQGGRREILAAELVEVSLVAVPMQPLARVNSVEI